MAKESSVILPPLHAVRDRSSCGRGCVTQFLLGIALIVALVVIACQRKQLLLAADGCGCNAAAQYHVASNRQRRSAIDYSVDMPPTPPPPTLEGPSQPARMVVGRADGGKDDVFYFPLYSQITGTALADACRRRYGYVTSTVDEDESNRTARKPSWKITDVKHHHASTVKHRSHRIFKQKICAPVHSLDTPQLVGERVHRSGSALRRGTQWLLTEFRTGNTVFHFDTNDNATLTPSDKANLDFDESVKAVESYGEDAVREEDIEIENLKRKRKNAHILLDAPSAIHTLAESFRGTDHTVAGPAAGAGDTSTPRLTFYYGLHAGASRIQALHLDTGRRITRLIDASIQPLYNNPTDASDASVIDLEVDQSALWALYRRANDSALSVVKMAPQSLKELLRWRLARVEPHRLRNAFVACGVLYTVSADGGRARKVNDEEEDGYDRSNNQLFPPTIENDSHNTLDGTVSVSAVFDFHSGLYIRPPRKIPTRDWHTHGSISNVQYDSTTDTLTVFDDGRIYSIALRRKRDE